MSQRICAVTCWLLALLATPALAKSVVEISFPDPGTVVNVGTMVVATRDADVDPASIQSVEMEYSNDGATWHSVLGAGTEGLVDPLLDYAVVWNAGSLPHGVYLLRAKVTDIFNIVTYSETVDVDVNAQPVATMQVSPTSMRFTQRYDGTLSSDLDGTIRSYDWDFGDGSRDNGPIVDHQFPGPGTYGISLTVIDDLGGTSTQHEVLALAAQNIFKIKAKNTCGCASMTVKSAGTVEGPAGFDFSAGTTYPFPAGENTNLGAYSNVDLTKAGPFDVRFRFEVIATLQPDSKPQLCEEGQRVELTYMEAGKAAKNWSGNLSSDARYDSGKSATDPFNAKNNGIGECGYGSQNWCDDDYHGGGSARGAGDDGKGPPGLKRYEEQKRILWLDSPGFPRVPKKSIPLSASRKFEAIVSGPRGINSCFCEWETVIKVDAAGVVTDNKLQNLVCKKGGQL